jgi:16S rRNA (cytidine1402-2'-O)-methyltransferase
MAKKAKLWVVATPIGNMSDLSARAADVLRDVAVIAAEDTRVTGKLLARAGIRTPLISYRDANEARLAPKLVARMAGGEAVALVSDAGTPCISDPGYRLVDAAHEAGIEVVAVPGPSTVTAFLSIAGLPTDRFAFEGFLPTAKAAREKALRGLAQLDRTVVLYESPRRVVALLEDVARLLDDPSVAVGRELTKLHEEILRGCAGEVAAALAARASIKGEVVVGIDLRSVVRAEESVGDEEILDRLRAGRSARDVAAELKERGVARRRVYELARRVGKTRT